LNIITNIMGHDLAIIVVWNFLFIGSYGIDTDVIHLLVLFEHQCCVHCLNMNVICLFILFRHECCVSIYIVYRWKSCTQLLCLNNTWHLRVNDMNSWNNIFHTDLEWKAYKFVMMWLVKKFRENLKDFNVKLNTNCKIWKKSWWVKFLNMKKILEKFQCIVQLNYSFYGGLFLNLNFDITMTYFLNPQFSFFVCDKHSVTISKVHNESIYKKKFIHNF